MKNEPVSSGLRDFIKLNRLIKTPSIFRAEDRGRFNFPDKSGRQFESARADASIKPRVKRESA